MLLKDIVNPEFTIAFSKLLTVNLPVKTAFKLAGINKILQEEMAKYGQIRNRLLTQYGKKDSEGNLITEETSSGKVYSMDNKEKFDKEYEELINISVDLPKIALSEMGDIELSAQSLSVLLPILEDDL